MRTLVERGWRMESKQKKQEIEAEIERASSILKDLMKKAHELELETKLAEEKERSEEKSELDLEELELAKKEYRKDPTRERANALIAKYSHNKLVEQYFRWEK